MNATVVLPPEVAAYLDRLRAALADLPVEERDELLADVEVSLLEDPGDAPELRLGPPERFARELRAAAGIEEEAVPARHTVPSLWEKARPHLRTAGVTALELAPAWWIARGYFAVCAVLLFGGFNWSEGIALIPLRGAGEAGLLLVLAGVAASVWLGLRTRRGRLAGGAWLTALNVVVAIAAVPVTVQIMDGRASLPQVGEVYYDSVAPPTQGLNVSGEPVRNVYAYDRDGKLLLDVLLYDDLGRPLEVGSAHAADDPLRRLVTDAEGDPVLNAFPIRYFEPGTQKVADPTAAPAEIEVPEIATPPLKRP